VLEHYLATAEEAARAGGEILTTMQGKTSTRSKGRNDLVTEADLASQQAIRAILLNRYPDHDFVGEESEGIADQLVRLLENPDGESPFRWIVDPLDGTTNYIHQLPHYAVSVALERSGEVLVGVVYDPVSGECYRAARGLGADLNGKPLAVSACRCASDALMAFGFPPVVQPGAVEIQQFLAIMHACQSIRRLGSAALNLCYIAAGRLDGYVAGCAKAWDVAAGMLIVAEAGGHITGIRGGSFDLRIPHFTCAATAALHSELLSIFWPRWNKLIVLPRKAVCGPRSRKIRWRKAAVWLN
jgi:myo-inositol-1(or 4)-monophosphatase